MKEKKRKVRSDKKTNINPTIHMSFYDTLCRLSYVCNCPLKSVGETLVSQGLNNLQVMEALSEDFRRPYWFNEDIMLNGYPERPKFNYVVGPEQHRIGLRFGQAQYDKLKDLAYALDTSLTKATSLLIEEALHNQDALSYLLEKYITEQLDKERIENLKQVVNFINASGGPRSEDITVPILLLQLFKTIGNKTKKMAEIVSEWIDKYAD